MNSQTKILVNHICGTAPNREPKEDIAASRNSNTEGVPLVVGG